jgi:alpha-galactosidase
MPIETMTRGASRVAWCAVACIATTAGLAGQPGKSPVKVFVLAGQSNMEGHGVIEGTQRGTLRTLVTDPVTAGRFKHLLAADGAWATRPDVWIAYGNKGDLGVGGYAGKGAIGPELGIGWVLGDFLAEQVLLVKVAVGGTSLAQNWRPPSSGGEVGGWYTAMVAAVKDQIAKLKTDFPGYDGRGAEITGFCWHQGWQDGCSDAMADEYEANMVNFIKDVRKDLGAPKLPFVIGGSGFGGWGQKVPRRLKISAAQQAAASREEFKDNVRYVETRGFFRPREESPTGFGYHWNCNAETYYLIGDGMGRAMVELLGGPAAPPNATNPSPATAAGPAQPRAELEVLKLPRRRLDLGEGVTLELVKLPAGTFLMGSAAGEEDHQPNELPQREVTIAKPFCMGVHEVTLAQYRRFVKETGREFQEPEPPSRGDHPASNVSWEDGRDFCAWLSKRTGATVRLPTEAEWEYACRGGATTRFAFGDDAFWLKDFGRHASDGWDGSGVDSPRFAPVGSFKPNRFGLHDMHGNLNEWCADVYAADYQPESLAAAAAADGTNAARALRGGHWRNNPDRCRAAARTKRGQGLISTRDGFRVVVEDR